MDRRDIHRFIWQDVYDTPMNASNGMVDATADERQACWVTVKEGLDFLFFRIRHGPAKQQGLEETGHALKDAT
jgi:hypothetical protein